jgi:hypothetical protein
MVQGYILLEILRKISNICSCIFDDQDKIRMGYLRNITGTRDCKESGAFERRGKSTAHINRTIAADFIKKFIDYNTHIVTLFTT